MPAHRDLRALGLLLTILLASAVPVSAQSGADAAERRDISDAEWRADLLHFAEQMPQVHVDLYHTVSRGQFEHAVWDLYRRLPELEDHEVTVELARIVAMIGDGHTRLWLTPNDANGFHQVPILLYWLDDGLYVLGITEQHSRATGGRVVRIGNVDVEEARERVRNVVHRDNEMQIVSIAPRYLAIPEVLHALRITDSVDQVTYTIVDQRGRRVEVELDAIPDAYLSRLSNRPFLIPSEGDRVRMVMAWGDLSEMPLWLSDPGNRFWYVYLPESRTMYVQLNGIRDKSDETMAAFFARVYAEVDRQQVDRLVLDLRHNGGGNNMLNLPVVHGIIERPELNRHGKVFVIISRHTFSAASHLVTYLERHTNAVFVGEPTGASPNHFGDAGPVDLPNSGLGIGASTMYWQNSLPRPFETRDWTPPDVSVAMTIEDFRTGRDPAMEAVLAYAETESLIERMVAALESDGAEAALAVYRDFRADPKNAYASTETEINSLGYQLLGAGRAEDAVAVFQLNADAYPESANVWDSLGDGYEAAGDIARAIASYARALQVDPGFAPSRANLTRLTSQ